MPFLELPGASASGETNSFINRAFGHTVDSAVYGAWLPIMNYTKEGG